MLQAIHTLKFWEPLEKDGLVITFFSGSHINRCNVSFKEGIATAIVSPKNPDPPDWVGLMVEHLIPRS